MAEQQRPSDSRLVRYTLAERVVHWTSGITFLYLLVTGLAFFTPFLYWLAALAGGGPTARAWHPWVGLIYTLTLLGMYRLWRRDMRRTDADRAWSRALAHYVRNEDDRVPPAGRFNAGQKQFFWAMFGSGILLLASGVILWVPDRIPWNFRLLRDLAVLVHPLAALVSIGGFLLHVYMGTAVVRESLSAMLGGEVSRAWARTHHLLWFREITGEDAQRK